MSDELSEMELDERHLMWEKNIDIVTAFLTTNGQIQITLVAAYATALAFLATWGNSLTGAEKASTFSITIPLFSLVALILALNVYSWIAIQISYLQTVALKHPRVREPITYFDYRARIEDNWLSRAPVKRFFIVVRGGFKYYIQLPFKMRDIYCYYFLIYVISPIACMVYVLDGKELYYRLATLIFVQILIVSYGLRDRLAGSMLSASNI
ncbi:hypothetical protein KG088_17935 [Halomonas sp. TRM85114]|uniref:hypothetical protein n=1 Tax=Halomonas jincaotanensis TaxID=2810616 RepID=UPI001BD29F4E|nr:hypothetical protein [Halomonas jincaotanensis]MBS9405487.1 hypothetical protein [Halomonas jincaotanensis]